MFYINLKEKYFESNFKCREIFSGKYIIKGCKASFIKINSILKESESLEKFLDRVQEIETAFSFIYVSSDFLNIVLVTDRFGSESTFYNDHEITDNIFKIKKKKISKLNVVQFLYFQRLYSDRTIYEDVKFAREARIFKFGTDIDIQRYWAPSFTKSKLSEDILSKKLADLITKSSSQYLSGYQSPSILLSGGLDSRVALAASHVKNLKAITLGSHKNNEFNVAKRLSGIKKIPIEFVKRDDSSYMRELTRSVDLGNGMQNIIHSHFYSVQNSNSHTDIFIHGHGFDYFFQGMYLPSDRVYFLGRSTLHNNLKEDYGDILDFYIKKIKFKLKSTGLNGYLEDCLVEEVMLSIKLVLKELYDEAKKLGATDDYDIWEFINCHSLVRHYTNLNLKSIEQAAPQVCISWHKDIYDFFYSLPHELKMNARILKKSLMYLNSDIAKTKNANINLPAHWDHRVQSYTHFFTLFLNKIGLKRFGPPSAKERSWPHGGDLLRTDEWKVKIDNIIENENLINLNLFDKNKLQKIKKEHMDGVNNYSDLLFSLVTLVEVLNRGKV